MTAKVLNLNVPSAMADLLSRRAREIVTNPETVECYLCQRPRAACVCAEVWFQGARAIAAGEGKREEWKAILGLLSTALDEMVEMHVDFDPFEAGIDEWHERDGLNEVGEPVELHDWLNLTRREFGIYATCSEMAPYLHAISRVRAKAHREQIDGDDVRNDNGRRLGDEQP